jgi:hypothetical protein
VRRWRACETSSQCASAAGCVERAPRVAEAAAHRPKFTQPSVDAPVVVVRARRPRGMRDAGAHPDASLGIYLEQLQTTKRRALPRAVGPRAGREREREQVSVEQARWGREVESGSRPTLRHAGPRHPYVRPRTGPPSCGFARPLGRTSRAVLSRARRGVIPNPRLRRHLRACLATARMYGQAAPEERALRALGTRDA